MLEAVIFKGDHLDLLDQRKLPNEVEYLSAIDAKSVAMMIKDMVVRGAPAIGITAAYGLVLELNHHHSLPLEKQILALEAGKEILAQSRPTAVNLFWALDRMSKIWQDFQGEDLYEVLKQEAILIHEEDRNACVRMGDFGASLIDQSIAVLTHCNAGALATGGYGTALGMIRSLFREQKLSMVYADETRPYLQGARLTAFELKQDQIPVTLICDNMAGHLMQRGLIQAVIVGADRIAKNGDTANKIGTYSLSVLAKAHGIPFYVVAPISTIDLKTEHGGQIHIEERSAMEVTHIAGKNLAPQGIAVRHPAFDVTPAQNITAIICEKGIAKPKMISTAELIDGIWLRESGFEDALVQFFSM